MDSRLLATVLVVDIRAQDNALHFRMHHSGGPLPTSSWPEPIRSDADPRLASSPCLVDADSRLAPSCLEAPCLVQFWTPPLADLADVLFSTFPNRTNASDKCTVLLLVRTWCCVRRTP